MSALSNGNAASRLVVGIPTRDRPEDLLRAIESVRNQTRQPEFVVVVGEAETDICDLPEAILPQGSREAPTPVHRLVNERTVGVAGALNSIVLHLLEQGLPPEETYVAFLDDDDTWHPDHLETCFAKAAEEEADLVVSGIIRHESRATPGRPQTIPETLGADDFLLGNPHLQNSNLFVRLSTLLLAGEFDEFLPSTLDRDLWIRLLDLGRPRIARVDKHLVDHWALDHDRLSTPGSPRKKLGLQRFLRKHAHRMSPETQALFHRRAEELFQVSLFDPPAVPQPTPEADSPPEPTSLSMDLVIGFTITYPVAARRLLEDIARLFDRQSPSSPLRQIVICDNTSDESLLANAVQPAIMAGLPVRVVSKREIDSAAACGRLSEYYLDSDHRKGVAFGRTALHTFLLQAAAEFSSPVVWILDDDVRLDDIRVGGPGRVESQGDLTRLFCGLRELGYSAIVGGTWGDPPLPAGVLLRTQLLDWSENLRALSVPRGPPVPSAQDDPDALRLFPEYYYDASLRHTGHLELPFGYPLDGREHSPAKALGAMLAETREILGGRELFRSTTPVFSIPPGMGLPNRGGNTLVFDLEVLAGCPNLSPRIGRVDARRGDTLWCVLSNALANSSQGRTKPAVGHFPWFVRHDRSMGNSRHLALLPVVADLYGRAFTRALAPVLAPPSARRGESGGEGNLLPAAPAGPFEALEQSKEELWETFLDRCSRASVQFQLNAWRIRGLVKTIRAQLETRAGWAPEAKIEVERHAECIESFLQAVERTFAEGAVKDSISGLNEAGRHDFLRFIEELPRIVAGYRGSQLAILEEASRRRDARLISTAFGAAAPEFLAAGNEGRVYVEGGVAYKVFRAGPRALSSDQLEFLVKSLPRVGESTHLVPILDSARVDGRLIIRMPLVDGERYSGGHLREILDLVRECRHRGIVLTNIHPDNLLVDLGGVRYIDLGRSIQPFTEPSFREMCKRAYLSYRWHFRSDLRELLSRSLYDEALPELTGFPEFLDAVETRTVHDLLDTALLECMGRCDVATVLDFGCGTGVLTAKLIARGYEVTAYDPDPECAGRFHQRPPGAQILDREALAAIRSSGRRFDAVVCSLVLCTIETTQEVEKVLLEARDLLVPAGHLILAICDPFSLDVGESSLAVKLGTKDRAYRCASPVEKLVKETGATRVDYHRPFAWYRGALHRAGFEVRESLETEGVDIPRLAPTSDFRIVVARAVRLPEGAEETTLLIRTCAMEWDAIDFQIRHIVSQLEGPRRFREKIVVYDGREERFARQYAPGNLGALESALRNLVEEGIIDRTLRVPLDVDSVGDLSLRWFGCRTTEPMSEGGQPIVATVAAFESCITPYVLQMDSDCLIGRMDRTHDFLGEMLEVFEADSAALTVSMTVPRARTAPFTAGSTTGKWRTEVRCSLLNLDRLRLALPLPNTVGPDGKLQLHWHRSLDTWMRENAGTSYRGGDARTWFVHVPNERKSNVNEWYNIAKAIERGRFFTGQIGKVDLTGSVADWLGRRDDSMALIVRGRNVPISKIRRCLRSLEAQDYGDWGVVFVDGASANGMTEYLMEVVGPAWRDRATFYLNHSPASIAENNFVAIRKLCSNPESIIVTVDADDLLIGTGALFRVSQAYQHGADATVGSMLRTDKEVTYPVTFQNARFTRGGGNVWQHLRTFRKRLFDRLREADLKIEGEWVEDAEDWAYMLPVVEMAEHPVRITDRVYWYEPSPGKSLRKRELREAIVANIVAKPPYGRGS